MVAMVVKARMVAKTGTSSRFPSGLSEQILDDEDSEDGEVNPGVFPLLLEPRDEVGRPKAGLGKYSW